MKITNAVSDGDKTLRSLTKLNPSSNKFPIPEITWQSKKEVGKHVLLNILLKQNVLY